jgi:hypothetical protein
VREEVCSFVLFGHEAHIWTDWPAPTARAMGKNSNAHKSRATIAEDIRRERERDEAIARKRARAEARLLIANGEMDTDGAGDGSSLEGASTTFAADAAAVMEAKAHDALHAALPDALRKKSARKKAIGLIGKKKVLIGKNKVMRKKQQDGERSSGVVAPVRKSLELKRGGIRKPSSLMRKTLKKLAKKREMDLG